MYLLKERPQFPREVEIVVHDFQRVKRGLFSRPDYYETQKTGSLTCTDYSNDGRIRVMIFKIPDDTAHAIKEGIMMDQIRVYDPIDGLPLTARSSNISESFRTEWLADSAWALRVEFTVDRYAKPRGEDLGYLNGLSMDEALQVLRRKQIENIAALQGELKAEKQYTDELRARIREAGSKR